MFPRLCICGLCVCVCKYVPWNSGKRAGVICLFLTNEEEEDMLFSKEHGILLNRIYFISVCVECYMYAIMLVV